MNSMYLNPPGTLWVHAAGYGHCGSMFTLRMAYDALCRGEDCIIFAWEESEERVQARLRSMHSYHDKFRELRKHLPGRKQGLPVSKVRSGLLSLHSPEERTLYEAVLQDLRTLGQCRIVSTSFSFEEIRDQIDTAKEKPRIFLDCNVIGREEGISVEDHYSSSLAMLRRVARDRDIAILVLYTLPRDKIPQVGEQDNWQNFPTQDFYLTPDFLTAGREVEGILTVWTLKSRLGNPGPSGPGVIVPQLLDEPELRQGSAYSGLWRARIDAEANSLVWEHEECPLESLNDPAQAATYLSKVMRESAGNPEMIRAALENVGRAHGWRKPGTKMEPAEAEQALKDLSAHYKEPVMPVGRYCQALQAWAKCIEEKRSKELAENRGPSWGNSWEDHVYKVFLNIRKSNLLYRLIYLGLPLRTRPCPLHKGHWSGLQPDPCPHGCSEGHNVTGWLLPEDKTP